MLKKRRILVITVLAIIMMVAMASTAFADHDTYHGQCKNYWDTIDFGGYLTKINDTEFYEWNDHNYKYNHDSGTAVDYTLWFKVKADDGTITNLAWGPKSSHSYSPTWYDSNRLYPGKLYLRIQNTEYTGYYMYSEGDWYLYP